jgi:hypothetical protein
MKIQKIKIFLATNWNLSLKLCYLDSFLFEIWQTWAFFHEKSFEKVKIIFFRSKVGENLPVQETLFKKFKLNQVWIFFLKHAFDNSDYGAQFD